MYRSLMVPLDGSKYSEHAIPVALGIARRSGASVQLVTVVSHNWAIPMLSTQSSSHLVSIWRDYLQGIVGRAQRDYGVPVSSLIMEAPHVAATLCVHAKDASVDLVVMSTHGRGALGRLWFGSVASKVVHHLAMPLLFIRPSDGESVWGKEPALKHMLVAMDGSSLAEQVLEPAVTFGKLMGADYELMRVINDIPFGTPELDLISLSSQAEGLLDEIQTVQARVQKNAEKYLEGVAERLRSRGLQVATSVVAASDAGKSILEALASTSYDLVALELERRHEQPDWLSVARKIIHGSAKPIFVQCAGASGQNNP